MYWIGYTTRYREGGRELARAAETMARELVARGIPKDRIVCERVESKRDFVDAMARVANVGRLRELHFLGHSGMYGPMFRTTAMPEQFSPHEWRTLALPFAEDGEAFFHACRTARWFAPFFARTFGVPTSGFHWYTTFSSRPDRFAWQGPAWLGDPKKPLYLIGCEGKKSHGLVVGSVLKYLGRGAEVMKRFEPAPVEGDASYDSVADLYDAVFQDIKVRKDEWRWLDRHFPSVATTGAGFADSGTRPLGTRKPRVLDIGCGNGALLRELAPRLASGVGVDASEQMIAVAKRHGASLPGASMLRFEVIDGPRLPFPDSSFDVVLSLLSFRYLDWDPLMNEIRRVLAPGGRILVIDMVTAPVKGRELPMLLRDTARGYVQRLTMPRYREALARLVAAPGWASMLRYNPIRAQHELEWYLESRFPGRKVEMLNVGLQARVLAFDSGPLEPGRVAPQSYP